MAPRGSSFSAQMSSPADEDPRIALVRQILASRTFAKSARLAQFLEFVCGKTIEGRAGEINEQQIGIHVFGRSPSYSAFDDSIVRTQARLLRQRLEEYFEHECPSSQMIVLIPKGGYVPVFEIRPQTSKIAQEPSVSSSLLTDDKPIGVEPPALPPKGIDIGTPPTIPEIQVHATGRNWMRIIFFAALGLLLVAAVAGIWRARSTGKFGPSLLWASLFSEGRPVVIVPSDDGLVLLEELRRAPVSLNEYLSGSYLRGVLPVGGVPQGSPASGGTSDSGSPTADWFSSHQYTSTADLNLAIRLGRLPEAKTGSVETRYARVMRLDDIKSSNVVLIGGIGANPWVGVFSRILTFDVNYDWKTAQGYVVNRTPRPGEEAEYRESRGGASASSYGVLAYLPGIEGNGHAVLFEGTGMAGTEAAADFPFNQEAFVSFLRQIGVQAGGPLPYFEVLLETRSIAGNAPESRVVTWHILKP